MELNQKLTKTFPNLRGIYTREKYLCKKLGVKGGCLLEGAYFRELTVQVKCKS